MAVTIKTKKKGTASVDVQTKAKGQVLTETHVAADVEAPEFGTGQTGTDGAMVMAAEALKPIAPYCEVGFEASYTHNMTNYESARVNVSIKIPCLHVEVDEAFEYAKSWVDEKLNAVNAEIKGA